MPMRRIDEAILAMQSEVELDPLSSMSQSPLGTAYFLARQYDRAIEQYRNALELSPHYGAAHMFLGMTLILLGKPGEGVRAVETGVSLMGRSPLFLAALGSAYAKAGRIGDAQKILAELQALAQKAYVPSFHFALIYMGLGETDKCLDWLEKAIEERDYMAFLLPVHPLFDPIRAHPRYPALIRKMNLEP
jgi:tetratricopeptide (TPR) repeat protein